MTDLISHQKLPVHKYHRFLDEAGDTTFYGKGKIPIIGNEGVSTSFLLGMLTLNEPVEDVRNKILMLQTQIAEDPYFQAVPSIQKKKSKMGFFLHAKDALNNHEKLVLNIAHRSKCTTHKNLEKGLEKANVIAANKYPENRNGCKMVFNVQKPTTEPIINIADYFLWALQRECEKGESRYVNFLGSRIGSVLKLYAPGES